MKKMNNSEITKRNTQLIKLLMTCNKDTLLLIKEFIEYRLEVHYFTSQKTNNVKEK